METNTSIPNDEFEELKSGLRILIWCHPINYRNELDELILKCGIST